MVPLVFRPFLQVQRTICPSVSQRASTRVPLTLPTNDLPVSITASLHVPFSSVVRHLPVVQTQRNTDTHRRHSRRDTHSHRDRRRHRQALRDARTRKNKTEHHVYSRRWSWPSFHRGGSSDPALRRHARHCGTRPATSVLVSPQNVFGGTQTSTLSPPPLLPSSRSFPSSSPCSRLTTSQLTVLEVHKTLL